MLILHRRRCTFIVNSVVIMEGKSVSLLELGNISPFQRKRYKVFDGGERYGDRQVFVGIKECVYEGNRTDEGK